MSSPEEIIRTYRFCFVIAGQVQLQRHMPEDEVLACVTCHTGFAAIQRAVENSHEWKSCRECRVEFCLEDALSPPVMKVFNHPACL